MDPRYIFLVVLAFAAFFMFGGNNEPLIPEIKGDPFQYRLEKKVAALKEQSQPTSGPGGLLGKGLAQGGSAIGTSPVQPYGGYNPSTATAGVYNNIPGAPRITPTQPAQDTSTPAHYLKDGRRIFFMQNRVLQLGPQGELQPLPDGVYELRGEQKMVIKRGRRVANPSPQPESPSDF